MPKVSIIVPVYNTGKYIKKCLNSLLNQSEKDIELIIINDGSKDNSDKIIKSYTDSRIKYIKKSNEGIGKTRNKGIKEASGEYIMFIDSDDYIDIDCVKKMYVTAKKNNLDILISNYYEDRNGILTEIKLKSFQNTCIKEKPEIINTINLGPCNKIYKNTLLKNNNIYFEEYLKYEDAPFVIKAVLRSNRIGKIDEALSYYVIHEKSETTIRDNRIFDIFKICDIIISELSEYKYMKKAMTNLITMILTDYTIQQRYITNKAIRNKFIDEAFQRLNNLDREWRKSDYLRKFDFIKRYIKTHKEMTKVYCSIYNKVSN